MHMYNYSYIYQVTDNYIALELDLNNIYVAIVRIGRCTSDIVMGAGIVYCTRNRS